MLPNLAELERYFALGSAGRAIFDDPFYLRKYPDVAASGMNPLRHYLRHGMAEHRKPNPLFEPHYYMAIFPESAPDPLLHFLRRTDFQGVRTHPLFDCEAYLRAHPDCRENPLAHYVRADARHTGAIPFYLLDVETHVDASEGRIRCAPEQQPFFRGVRYDQILPR